MNAETPGYLVSGDRVKRTPFEQPFVFRETVKSTIRDTLNLARTTTGGVTGVSTNLAKIARRTQVKSFEKKNNNSSITRHKNTSRNYKYKNINIKRNRNVIRRNK
jgi:hypothetical protein